MALDVSFGVIGIAYDPSTGVIRHTQTDMAVIADLDESHPPKREDPSAVYRKDASESVPAVLDDLTHIEFHLISQEVCEISDWCSDAQAHGHGESINRIHKPRPISFR